MNLTLHVWRQAGPADAGRMVRYEAGDISPDMSFLEMLDVVNERLMLTGETPIAFDHDCREGICGACSLMINGVAHGPNAGTATCQLHMRSFDDGDEIYVEPWRARAFPVIKDLVVNRSALDRIIAAGGFISAPTGSAVDGNTTLIPKEAVDTAMDAAQCIGCGACVAACPNGSASLFTAAKITHLGLLPQGQPERLLAGAPHGRADGRGGVRRLHPVRRVPGSLPQADQHRHDHPNEPGLPPGRGHARARGGRRVGLKPALALWLALLVPAAGDRRRTPDPGSGRTSARRRSSALERADPVPGGGSLAELRVVQPVLHLQRRRPGTASPDRRAQSRRRHDPQGRARSRATGARASSTGAILTPTSTS